MEQDKKFIFWNRICAAVAFVVSAVTYLLTIEPTASFWDCGEFIASSYKLEVGHPPGNPMFQIIARFFTLFGDNMHAAVLVNAMSAICSALTIFFLYLTIVWLARRVVKSGNIVAICGSALVGSLAYCFSDTFWFSAVEGEVYAMSSLFTAMVFWAMTRWYDEAFRPHAGRWIVLISLLMGLSLGVHLLNLLVIPALVFMFYFRRREDRGFTLWELVKIFVVGVVILALILFVIIPYLPKFAAYTDLFFVNVLGLPYNTGAVFFMALLLGLCFWGLFVSLRKEKVVLNTALLCLTTIIVGFSVFSVDIIRSCAKTPTNEYQPDNAFTLVRYLSREQYGSNPLVYGQYYDSPYRLKTTKYWAPLDGKYKRVDGPVEAEYRKEGKMLFPRMWNGNDPKAVEFYELYTGGKGRYVPDADHRKPTMWANLSYFFDYQLGWMYARYFMWNFVGRQNDIHGQVPGDIFHGNWESGIGFIDSIRLGNQSDAPESLAGNKGKNHYFFLPLLLGLLGLFFQFERDKRGCWITFLLFFMTGIAIVIYLNQPPYQVRERDYAYAGSFYFFSVWIGLAVAAVSTWLDEATEGKHTVLVSAATSVALLFVPALMAAQNWDDHDRSNRRTAVEMARNYLNSVGENGILVTHGDNDTFPLWYVQEVEDFRQDVRICNTSLLGTDWYIDQMKWASNLSTPLKLGIGQKQYLYGTNEFIPIYDVRETEMDIKDVMTLFRHPEVKVEMNSGNRVDYIASRKISVPVNRENVVKYGILDAKYYDMIPDKIVLNISGDYISKPELFMLDLLSNYEWDRPINLLSMGGDLNLGLKPYMQYMGYSSLLVPVKCNQNQGKCDPGFVDTDKLYSLMKEKYSWKEVSREDYFADYQNQYTHMGVMSVRGLFCMAAQAFMNAGENDRAIEMLDMSQKALSRKQYPLESVPVGFAGNDYMVVRMIEDYYKLGQDEKGKELALALSGDLLKTAVFYAGFYDYAKNEFEVSANLYLCVADILKANGEKDLASGMEKEFKSLFSI